jgi:glutamate synthase (NADPH/NADH) small chain
MVADASLVEVSWITESMGIEVRTDVEIGKDTSFATLLDDFDAVFLGVGLGPDSRLQVQGEGLDGVVGGVEVIERWKTGGDPLTAGVTDAVVVGGGNTSLDAVRELLELGIPRVTLTYRREAGTMPGYEHEWKYAQTEGALASWNSQPVRLLGEGRVQGVECQRMEPDPSDPSGRGLRVVPDSSFVLPAQLVVVAVGQGKLEQLLSAVPGVELDRGRVVTDSKTGATGNSRVFAGGDAANGGKEVVNAAHEGKVAAQSICSMFES